jgi:DNA-3-methyladenine glycosylase I
LPATTPESTALSKELKRRGFRFVGPTTVYAFMQSAGFVDDHLVGCYRRGSASRPSGGE